MTGLADRIRADLRAAADPERASAQQAYMKSAMPFLGVAVPEARRVARAAAKGVRDAEPLRRTALELWDAATYREERYAALALLATAPVRAGESLIPLIEHMVRTGQWWDFTDELAHRLADELDARPVEAARVVRGWAVDQDFWMRRIAIISQLGRRERVDRMLLADVIVPNVDDGEFFVRKAIGWALRELARIDPEWVRGFVEGHALSPLSRREALKHLV